MQYNQQPDLRNLTHDNAIIYISDTPYSVHITREVVTVSYGGLVPTKPIPQP